MKKNIVLSILFAIVSVVSFSKETDVKVFKLKNGIPVYYKKNNGSKIDALSIVVKGGIACYPKEESGIEDVLFSLMCQGSQNYSEQKLKYFCYSTNSIIDTSTGKEGSVLRAISLSRYFDDSIKMVADIFKNPLFQKKSYDKIMDMALQNIQSEMNDPQSLVFYYAMKMIYDGHPYSVSPTVTDESYENISLQKIIDYHKSVLDSRRISIVVYTNFSPKKILERLNQEFGDIESGTVELKKIKIPKITIPSVNGVFFHPDAAKTGYGARIFASAPVNSPDYPVARVASLIYDEIMFNVVREKYGACYTPSSILDSSFAPFGMEYIFKISDLQNFKTYVEEARNIMAQGKVISGRDENGNYIFDDLENRLEGYKNSYINQKFSSQSKTAGIISRMTASLLQFDDVNKANDLTVIAKNTTKDDILRVFKKYWMSEPLFWVIIVSSEDESKVQ